MYEKFFKRFIDFSLSFTALILLSPILLVFTIIGAFVMKGNPFFVQPRPGKIGKDGKEKIFKLMKFRSMSNAKDKEGNLLPDDVRLSKYGRFLRKTSIDELPSLFNIVIGDLAICGPRPLLVEYLPYYTEEERTRHNVRPGLTGWAQVNGRNALDWEKRFQYDVYYVQHISLKFDIKIIFMTVSAVVNRKGVQDNPQIEEGNMAHIRAGKANEQMERNHKEMEVR